MKTSAGVAYIVLSLLAALLWFQPGAYARSPEGRPKVGLVLSGGGALGMAHVGVIKVMEEAGLKPDYITGVSMGSIIGGMYSIGYDADSLHKILISMDWNALLTNKIPLNRIVFSEKRNYYNSVISLPLSFNRINLPSGLINGQMVENSLSFYAWPAADITDFSGLPIPFMCIGTDLITGKKVDLKSGSLSNAMRASMAVPTIFTPVKIDTALIVDGGILRNFAASEVREMGADIVIGSYVGAYPFTEEKLHSVPEIIWQLVFSMSIKDFDEERKQTDLVIMPELQDILPTDFNNVDTIVQRGYRAALPYRDYFRKIADSLNMIGKQYPADNLLDKQYYSFDRIDVNGNHTYSDRQVMEILGIKPGQQVDKYLLTDRIELLYGKAWFEKVNYRIIPRNDSLILAIECTGRPKGILYGSVHYDDVLSAAILLRLSARNLLSRGSVIDLDSYIGQYYRARASITQFIDRHQMLGISAEGYTERTLFPFFDIWQGEKGRVISRYSTGGLTINRNLGINNSVSLSCDYEDMDLIPEFVTETDLKYISYQFLTASLDFNVNTLNKKYYPDHGSALNLSAGTSRLLKAIAEDEITETVYTSDQPGEFDFNRFFTLRGSFEHYFSNAGRFTFSVSGNILYISGDDATSRHNNFFLLGGTDPVNRRSIPMTGFHTNEIPVRKLAGIGTGFDWELFKDFHVNLVVNAYAAQEIYRTGGYSLLTGGGMGVGYMSVIGPLKAGLMFGHYSNEEYFKQIKGYISLGFNF
jgi:NTE family protein